MLLQAPLHADRAVRAFIVWICWGSCFVAAVSAQARIHPDELKLKPRIDAAIASGVEALLERQLRDGTWGRYGNYDGGKTALVAYALLKSGVSAHHPAVRRALLYLDRVRPSQTYTVACMMLAYAAAGGDEHLAHVKELARLLIEWQREGDFGYPHPHNGQPGWSRPDLSNTQYAALGLWIAQQHKVKVPSKAWRGLIEATLKYQSKSELIPAPRTGTHTTAGGKVGINGFGYVRGRGPTGSMTTAGVSILQICRIGLGERLGKDRRRVEDAVAKGVAWLGHHFRVNGNPGAGDSWKFYYLYGLERVGSLTRIEQMGDHWWFLEGARHLLETQQGDGIWARGAQRETQTAFALLFLRRATSGAAATGRNSVGTKHLFSAGGPRDGVSISAAGQQPLALWIPDFGAAVKARHKLYGIRVVGVEYREGDRSIGQLVGDPTKAWTTDAFLHREHALPRGEHRIKARVTLVARDVPTGGTTPTERIESPEMRVKIRDVWADWMAAAAAMTTPDNLLRTTDLTITATSNPDGAKLAADGNDTTHWVCARTDERPELTIELAKPVTASKIVLTQPGSRSRDRGIFDHILNVELFINRYAKPLMIEMDEDQMAVTTFKLPRKQPIRRLRLRIVLRLPGRRAFQAGFSEIALMK